MANVKQQILGHTVQMETLWSALQNQKLPHALMFVGPNSIGKKKVALALAQALLCERTTAMEVEACGQCGSCKRVANQQSENLRLLQPEGTQIKVDQVRDLLDYLSLASFDQNRVIIIDQAHMMNQQAANSLLKTLEEPSSGVYFILIGPDVSLFLPTIRSRSQVIRFSALTNEQLKQIKPGAPSWSYNCARGQVDRIELLASSEGSERREAALALLENFWLGPDFLSEQKWRDLVKDREQAQLTVSIWTSVMRDLLVLKSHANKFVLNVDQPERLKKLFPIQNRKISDFSVALMQAEKDLIGHADPVLLFESMWVRYARH